MSKSRYKFCPRCSAELVERELGGAPRRVCVASDCDFIHWDNPIPVVAAVIVSDTREAVLLVRNVGWPESMYGLVSGFLERDENPDEGVAREIEEETGLRAASVRLIGNYGFSRAHQVLLCYEVVVSADATITLNEELADAKWISVARLKPWPFGTGYAVRDWLEAEEVGQR